MLHPFTPYPIPCDFPFRITGVIVGDCPQAAHSIGVSYAGICRSGTGGIGWISWPASVASSDDLSRIITPKYQQKAGKPKLNTYK